MEPLAYTLRPKRIDDIYGQLHLIGPNGVIRRMIKGKIIPSMILYGQPGIGKTTLAYAICEELNATYLAFNASSDNKATLKKYIDESKQNGKSILIIDEIHRMKKDIQDYLLTYIEEGSVIIIGLTTINPYHSVNPAIRSRCLIFKLNELSDNELKDALYKSINKINPDLKINQDAADYIVQRASGEVRFLINALEGITFILEGNTITLEDAKMIVQKPSISIDKNEDNYYDTLSGLQKSIRGSDVDASLHYLAKLLSSEDLLPLIRRLSVIAYEDIGLANPGIGPKVRAATEVALDVGMPEARIPLSVVVVEMALSPKSNSAYLGLDAAMEDINNGKSGPLPKHLYPQLGNYLYPHDFPGAWVDQQYLPDNLKDASYYQPLENSKYEKALKDRYDAIKKAKYNKHK